MSKRTFVLLVVAANLIFILIIGIFLAIVSSKKPAADSSTFEITLERTPCFGFCPAYTVRVNQEGSVSFTGQSYTRHDGKTITYKVPSSEASKLWQKVINLDFFQLKNEYVDNRITDIPSFTITVKSGTYMKSVKTYGLEGTVPKFLIDLSRDIDNSLATQGYFDTQPGM